LSTLIGFSFFRKLFFNKPFYKQEYSEEKSA